MADDVFVNLVTDTKKSLSSLAKYTMAIGAAMMAVNKLAKVGKDLVESYFKQERAETKLTAALKATGFAVGMSTVEMKKYAKEMQRTTGIGDELILDAQGVMTTFTKIGKDVFPQAINAAADMSAMFGQDLQQSVISLGTALNDPIAGIGRLRRIGISFTDEQKETIAGFMELNDVASAQQVIIDELTAEFGGVAEAMGNTAEGGVMKLSTALGDLKESIGGLIAVEGKGLISLLTEMAEKIKGTAEELLAYREVINGLARDKPRSLDDVTTDIDTMQKSIAHLNSELDRGLGRKFLEGGLIGSSIRDAVLNKRLKAQQQELTWLQMEQRGLAINAKIAAESDAEKLVALEKEAAAFAEQEADMKALMDAWGKTAEGQEAALLNQIAYFEEFQKGPMAVAVLASLNEEYERLYGITAKFTKAEIGAPFMDFAGLSIADSIKGKMAEVPGLMSGLTLPRILMGEGPVEPGAAAGGPVNPYAFPFTETSGDGGKSGTRSSAMAAYRRSLEEVNEVLDEQTGYLTNTAAGWANYGAGMVDPEKLKAEAEAMADLTDEAMRYGDAMLEIFSQLGEDLAEGATGWEAFGAAGKAALLMIGKELVAMAALQAAKSWAAALDPLAGGAANIPAAMAWTALAGGGGAAVGFAGAYTGKAKTEPQVVVNVAGSIRSDLEIEGIIANAVSRMNGVN